KGAFWGPGLRGFLSTPPQQSPRASPSPAMPIFSMTLGAVSNMVALAILAQSYARFRRRSKATFLLFASSLVITDFAGHVIPGAFVLRLYATRLNWEAMDSTGAICQFFGACMVFFGLCPLFLGCVMAVERCVGVTRPLLHASLVTSVRTKLTLMGGGNQAGGNHGASHAGSLRYQRLLFLGVRLASWNQILDPWVYILLRRAVLRKLFALLRRQPPSKGSRFERWEVSSFQSSERSVGGRL
uniref:Thromboxane A2 receptor n=1 Tax=Pelusios castaneus TaxID=367368 RepID=A0A8C8RJ05_9SAUR